MQALIEPLLNLVSYKKTLECIKNKKTPVLLTGVIDVQKDHLIYSLEEQLKKPFIIITNSELKAKEIYQDMLFFTKNIMYYPSKDIIFYSADVHSMDIEKKRLSVLNSLIRNKDTNIVLSVEALFDKLMPKADFSKYLFSYNVGDVVKIDDLLKKLLNLGYERCEKVESAGQFSLRGGILDIYSPIEDNPFRIEFWDDEIDSIRVIDPYSQRSVEKVDTINVFPVRELIYDGNYIREGIKSLEKEYENTKASYIKNGFSDEVDILSENVGEDIARIKELNSYSKASSYINFLCKEAVSILDYVSNECLIIYDEPQKISNHASNIHYEFQESLKGRISKGYMLPSSAELIFGYDDIKSMTSKFQEVLLSSVFNENTTGFDIVNKFNFNVKSIPVFHQRVDLFCDEIKKLREDDYKVFILAGAQSRGERLLNELLKVNIEASFIDNLNSDSAKIGNVVITKGSISRGFRYDDLKLAIFSDQELIGDESRKRRVKKKKKGAAIESFTDLKVGDYVVHDNHGIGIFQGLEQIIVDGINKDYIKIGYANGGSLFVPVNQMDIIQKYIGSGSSEPRLNKLGGQEWVKAKKKVRAAVELMAEDLVKLYAKRRAAKGFVYSKDNSWQKEFEENFPYEETDDQITAIEDVKNDMESTKIMDRLICGDVGYGKTEVAIRAAFKAVQDGKQVAYLVPTTILAQQHFNTFEQRMRGYPIKVDTLSRFRTAKEQKETLKSLEKGFVDIVIGTHRLLSKDVKFKDLGIVIVDEEQRFGVSHKEKLKKLQENVDIMTLTATPIPRTLHMSLSGIRDMSILEEPPLERHPIQTYVMEYNMEFVRDAVHRELSRGGQAYYLHNRVHNIVEVAQKIQNSVPEARVSYAHGQMTERELESIMKDFISGEIDVLVCTTIIETGLDIPNVNTIIIQDADHMGLSQLYQLRGRVGRSNKIAYAYLMYQKNKVLQEVAEKRLQTIKEFTEFGSGFKIAMRDLEIRGAGNLLGSEQHGHMEAVGYDMYCRLLDEAVRNLKGEDIKEIVETTIDINVSAYIPSYYIRNEEQKLEVYKKISLISDKNDYYDMQEEIEDRFGNIPKPVQALLEIVLLKTYASKIGILSITQKQKNLIVMFKSDAKIDPDIVTKLIKENKNKFLFTASEKPYLTAKISDEDNKSLIGYIKSLLQHFNSFE